MCSVGLLQWQMFRVSRPTLPFPHPAIVLLMSFLLDSIVASLSVLYVLMDVVESAMSIAPRLGGSISSAREAAVSSPTSLSVF